MEIPDNILDIVLGETYDGEYTLRQELANVSDIIHAEWEISQFQCGRLNSFIAWTKDDVIILIDFIFGDQGLIKVRRNP